MSLESGITKRIFLVGAARSGTTLLQSMIAAHSQVHSFPETHFFTLVPRSGKKQYIVPLGERQREKVKMFLEEVERADLIRLLPRATYSKKKWARGLIHILDELTVQSGYHMWLEKTPMHLYYIDLITEVAPDTQFIHMIRNGQDVVASTYDATRKYPEEWGGSRSIDHCLGRCTNDVELSLKYLGQSGHVFIRYEELVSSPETQLK
ncbi:MAG: sulfotransferase, partial [Promethearchaeota archaeon]